MRTGDLSGDSAVRQEYVVAQRYRMNAGTSMASPFITGLLALLLEQQPQTTPEQAKAWLKQRSSIPGSPAAAHDSKWGYGLVRL